MRSAIAAWSVVLSLSCPMSSLAAPFRVVWHGTGGWGDKNAYCALFDPKTVQTVEGTVVSIDNITPMPGMRPGVQLQLKNPKGLIPVHLGPLWYLENQDIDLKPNDTVEVTGSRVFCVNQDVIMAMEIRHGNKTIKLRDPKGRPLWIVTHP
jgi:hypothetical protein